MAGTQASSRTPDWWPLYYPDDPFDVKDRRAELVFAMIDFFTGPGFQLLERACNNEHASEELVRNRSAPLFPCTPAPPLTASAPTSALRSSLSTLWRPSHSR